MAYTKMFVFSFVLICLYQAPTALAQKKGKKNSLAPVSTLTVSPPPIVDSVAYALGLSMGQNLQQNKMLDKIDVNQFMLALTDLKSGVSKFDQKTSEAIIRDYFTKRYQEMLASNALEEKLFLEKNALAPGVKTAASGLQYIIERPGNETKPTKDNEVEVHYRGTLLNGEEFDSSYGRGQTTSFALGKVIPAWTEALQYIGEGGKIKIFAPSKLAYGEAGMQGSVIEPNACLIFEVELIQVKKAATPSFPDLRKQ